MQRRTFPTPDVLPGAPFGLADIAVILGTLVLLGFATVAAAVDWGRYAELFEYDASEERLYLPQP